MIHEPGVLTGKDQLRTLIRLKSSRDALLVLPVHSASSIVMTPPAKDELSGPRGAGYRRMIDGSLVGHAGTPDEVAAVAALLIGPEGGFISDSGILMDGGVTISYWFGEVAKVR